MFNLDAVVVVTIGVALQAMLVGMLMTSTTAPVSRRGRRPGAHHRRGERVVQLRGGDSGLGNLAAVRLPEMGFTGRRVARVLGITQEYVSMLWARARAEGSAGLMCRRGRPAPWGASDLGRAR